MVMSDPRVVVKLFTSCASILMPDPLIQDVCDDTIAPLTWSAACGALVLIPTPLDAWMRNWLLLVDVKSFNRSSDQINELLCNAFALDHIATEYHHSTRLLYHRDSP